MLEGGLRTTGATGGMPGTIGWCLRPCTCILQSMVPDTSQLIVISSIPPRSWLSALGIETVTLSIRRAMLEI